MDLPGNGSVCVMKKRGPLFLDYAIIFPDSCVEWLVFTEEYWQYL